MFQTKIITFLNTPAKYYENRVFYLCVWLNQKTLTVIERQPVGEGRFNRFFPQD